MANCSSRANRSPAFFDADEKAVGLTEVVPFLVEDILKANGGRYTTAGMWKPHFVTGGLLTTGQNPASSAEAATKLLEALH
jgi:putative intracellular protease/amidase